MKFQLLYTALLCASLLGCASMPTPQNAQQYRTAVTKGYMGSAVDTYEVNRPYSEISRMLKTQANTCLRVHYTETECVNKINCKDREIFYTPTVITKADRTELHVQWRREPFDGVVMGGPPPATGMYITVVDANPAGSNKTRLTVYAPSSVFRSVPDAVKHWSNGTNMGCPNFGAGKYK